MSNYNLFTYRTGELYTYDILEENMKIANVNGEFDAKILCNLLNGLSKENDCLIKQLLAEKDRHLESIDHHLEFIKKTRFDMRNESNILRDFINILNEIQADPTNEKNLNVARDMLQNMGEELK